MWRRTSSKDNHGADIEILKEIVQEVVSSIDQDVLRAVMANFEKRIICA